MQKLPVFKLWLTSAVCLMTLILSLAFIFPNAHFPTWLELVLKGMGITAFLVIVLAPLLHVATRFWRTRQTRALTIAAYITIAGYALLFGQLLYVKLKACDPNAIPHDSSWHCNVSGKATIVYFVLIPLVATFIGLIFAVISWIRHGGKLGNNDSKDSR